MGDGTISGTVSDALSVMDQWSFWGKLAGWMLLMAVVLAVMRGLRMFLEWLAVSPTGIWILRVAIVMLGLWFVYWGLLRPFFG